MKQSVLHVVPLALITLNVVPLRNARASESSRSEVLLGSKIPVKMKSINPDQAGFLKKGFARCIYALNKPMTMLILERSDPVSVYFQGGNQFQFKKALGMETCLGEQPYNKSGLISVALSFTKSLVHFMLEEEDYLAKFPRPPVLPATGVEDTGRQYFSPPKVLDSARALGTFSDCLTFRNTAGADAVLRTLPDSSAEMSAARALTPTLRECLVTGQTLELKPANIRNLAADGLWARYAKTSRFPTFQALQQEQNSGVERTAAFQDVSSEKGDAVAAKKIELMMSQTSDCVVASRLNLVENYLKTQRGSEEENKAYAQLSKSPIKCRMEIPQVGNGTKFIGEAESSYASAFKMPSQSVYQRGLLARALLKTMPKPAASPDVVATADYGADWMSRETEPRVSEEMAACLAMREPTQVMEVIYADPLSPKERSATAAIFALTGQCLVHGATLKINGVGLRAVLAEAFYHLMAAPTLAVPQVH